MTPDNIVTLAAIIIGFAVLLWIAIKANQTNLTEDFR